MCLKSLSTPPTITFWWTYCALKFPFIYLFGLKDGFTIVQVCFKATVSCLKMKVNRSRITERAAVVLVDRTEDAWSATSGEQDWQKKSATIRKLWYWYRGSSLSVLLTVPGNSSRVRSLALTALCSVSPETAAEWEVSAPRCSLL